MRCELLAATSQHAFTSDSPLQGFSLEDDDFHDGSGVFFFPPSKTLRQNPSNINCWVFGELQPRNPDGVALMVVEWSGWG